MREHELIIEALNEIASEIKKTRQAMEHLDATLVELNKQKKCHCNKKNDGKD